MEVELVDEQGSDSWRDGKIKKIKNGHYVVKFPGGDQAIAEMHPVMNFGLDCEVGPLDVSRPASK